MSTLGHDWATALAHEARPVQAEAPRQAPRFADTHPAEAAWIASSEFEFAVKMRAVLIQWGGLTAGQLDAVRRCMASAARRAAVVHTDFAATELRVAAAAPIVSLGDVPPGLYAVPDGTTRLKVKIAKPEGKWAGWTFVSDAGQYGTARRYGTQRPGEPYRGLIAEQLAQIVADPAAASAAYGRLTGTCGICGRPLENEESVARGIGPICAGRVGW